MEIIELKNVIGGCNIPLSIVDRTPVQKIIKEPEDLNNIINQLDLTEIYKHCIQQQQNTHSSQMHIEHSPG